MITDAVYVTYKAEIKLLEKSLSSIVSQVRNIYIIDNTPNKDIRLDDFKSGKVKVIYLEENCGVAFAQNVGIKKALENSVEYIMLSDQDTCYPINYIEDMLKVFSYDKNIAAIAPRFVDCKKKNNVKQMAEDNKPEVQTNTNIMNSLGAVDRQLRGFIEHFGFNGLDDLSVYKHDVKAIEARIEDAWKAKISDLTQGWS